MTDQEIATIADAYSMTGPVRIMGTVRAVRETEHLAGDIVECGVWRGGNIIAAMLAAQRPRRFWLFDTFEGMTEPGEHDWRRGRHATEAAAYRKAGASGWCRSELPEVKANVERYRRADQEVRYIQGPVEHTLLGQDLPDRIVVLRLDTDFYDSTRAELEVLWPRVVPGGILIVDDYGSWDGCRRACDEYFGADAIWEMIKPPTVRRVKS